MIDPRRLNLLKCMFVRQHSCKLAMLLAIFLAVNCISLAAIERSVGIAHEHVLRAIAGVLLAAGFIPLFLFARFSFGFIVGVSFYCVLTGFVWITYFSAL